MTDSVSPEKQIDLEDFFVVDLSQDAEFDPAGFDSRIQRVGVSTASPDRSSGRMYHAKFVVIDDKMIIFSAEKEHREELESLRRGSSQQAFNGVINWQVIYKLIYQQVDLGII